MYPSENSSYPAYVHSINDLVNKSNQDYNDISSGVSRPASDLSDNVSGETNLAHSSRIYPSREHKDLNNVYDVYNSSSHHEHLENSGYGHYNDINNSHDTYGPPLNVIPISNVHVSSNRSSFSKKDLYNNYEQSRSPYPQYDISSKHSNTHINTRLDSNHYGENSPNEFYYSSNYEHNEHLRNNSNKSRENYIDHPSMSYITQDYNSHYNNGEIESSYYPQKGNHYRRDINDNQEGQSYYANNTDTHISNWYNSHNPHIQSNPSYQQVSQVNTLHPYIKPINQPPSFVQGNNNLSNSEDQNINSTLENPIKDISTEAKQPNLESVSTQNLPSGATLSHYRLQQPSSFQFTCFTETDMKQLYGGEKLTTRRKLMKQKRLEGESKGSNKKEDSEDNLDSDKVLEEQEENENKIKHHSAPIQTDGETNNSIELNSVSINDKYDSSENLEPNEVNVNSTEAITPPQRNEIKDDAELNSSKIKLFDQPNIQNSTPAKQQALEDASLNNSVSHNEESYSYLQNNYKFPQASQTSTRISPVSLQNPNLYPSGGIQASYLPRNSSMIRKRSYDHTVFEELQANIMQDYSKFYSFNSNTGGSWQRSKSVPNLDDQNEYYQNFVQQSDNYEYSSHPSSTNSSPRGVPIQGLYDRRLRRRVSLTEDVTPPIEDTKLLERRNSADVSHLFYTKGYISNIRRASMPNTHINIPISGLVPENSNQPNKEHRRSSVSSLIGPGFREISLNESDSANKSHEEWFRKYKQHEVDENLQSELANFKFGSSSDAVESQELENDEIEHSVEESNVHFIQNLDPFKDRGNIDSRRVYKDQNLYVQNIPKATHTLGFSQSKPQFETDSMQYSEFPHYSFPSQPQVNNSYPNSQTYYQFHQNYNIQYNPNSHPHNIPSNSQYKTQQLPPITDLLLPK